MSKFVTTALFINVLLYYSILFIDFLRSRNVNKILNNNAKYKYLQSNSDYQVSMRTKKNMVGSNSKFITYILAPIVLSFPIMGQCFLLLMVYDEIMAFKVSTKEYVNEQCEKYFLYDLNDNLSDINKNLKVIQTYSNEKDIHLIRKFLMNKQHSYYQLGFEGFVKLLDIVIEKNNQIAYSSNDTVFEIMMELKELIKNYVDFIETLNKNNLSKDNKIKDYSNFLATITDELKNRKY